MLCMVSMDALDAHWAMLPVRSLSGKSFISTKFHAVKGRPLATLMILN